MRMLIAPALAGLTLFILSACGGGGGGGGGKAAPIPAGNGITSPDDGQFHIDRRAPIIFVQEAGQPAPPPVIVNMNYSLPVGEIGPEDLHDAWVTASKTGSTGPHLLEMTIGVSDAFVALLPQGHYKDVLEFQEFTQCADCPGSAFHKIELPVMLIIPQQFSMQHSDMSVAQGQDGATAPLHLPLRADGVRWSARTDSPWLTVAQASGTGSATLDLQVSDTTLAVGPHQATVTVTDLDYDIPETMTITVHVQARALVTRDRGFALTSAPGWSALAAAIPIVDNAGLPSTWTASSDQSWLVLDNPAGASGTALNVHAVPAGLSAGMHYAQVSVTPATAGVAAPQTVRVGLFVSATPAAATTFPSVPPFRQRGPIAACDPIRPYCYSVDSTGVAVYDLFSGLVAATLPAPGFTAAISPDGKTLYVANDTSHRIVPVDLDSMTVGAALPLAAVPTQPQALPSTYRLLAGQVGGQAVLVTNELHLLDPATGRTLRDFSALLPARVDTPPAIAISHDGRQILVRSQDNALLYRMEVDSDGSLGVGTTETYQELPIQSGGEPFVRDLAFAIDDASFLCTSDQIRRYSSSNFRVEPTFIAGLNSSYVQARHDDSLYLFTKTAYDTTGNILAWPKVDHLDADNRFLENVLTISDMSNLDALEPQLVLSADQRRLVVYTRNPAYFVDLP